MMTTNETNGDTPLTMRLESISNKACTPDFCFVCSRATDHWGEHSDEQLLEWAKPRRSWFERG